MASIDLQRLELFADNAQTIKKEFIWQHAMIKRLAALLYTAQNKAIDIPAIQECYALIKINTGLFSTFRGNTAMTIATLLSLSENPDERFSDTLKAYEVMKQQRFGACDYLVIAAYQIAANASRDEYAEKIRRMRAFYDSMKDMHRFLTGQDDYIFSAMLALSDIDIRDGVRNMERCFEILRPEFHSGMGVQALTQVLVLGGSDTGIETRVLDLRNALKNRGLKLNHAYTLSSLGVLALLPLDTGDIADQIERTSELLRCKQGFGIWSVTKQELLLLSVGLVSLSTVDQVNILNTALSTSITNIIIAQQAAIIAASAAASASAAAASS